MVTVEKGLEQGSSMTLRAWCPVFMVGEVVCEVKLMTPLAADAVARLMLAVESGLTFLVNGLELGVADAAGDCQTDEVGGALPGPGGSTTGVEGTGHSTGANPHVQIGVGVVG